MIFLSLDFFFLISELFSNRTILMLLLLALVALAAAQLPEGCDADHVWLDISVRPAVYRCLPPGKRTTPIATFARAPVVARASICPIWSNNGVQDEINM